ncbi:hypothetical protein PUNSTDRAFT_145533 [Punctularia strigosozonata HHB-11173 SS5]|uniref:uncharacterized protein n=1 Tax=Punctularia strigosozonata (strain HHB-11173) TaxID=741275 RepID=UPI0004416C22|nr:uncharacterized protein PUNSTDRAFT_145533 [Punctularia strigosozonata HHB-11173 SS5]EIN06236.1 hypothetical protein PUNSTDRAFT_145533 [Punctularia strigosozonata HHB-11173 SS5]
METPPRVHATFAITLFDASVLTMIDGTRLRQSWYNALNEAETNFRRLVTSSSSPEWKRVLLPAEDLNAKGKLRATEPQLSDVVIHRRVGKKADNVHRIILDVNLGSDPVSLESWRSVIVTPELRKEWDPAVEAAQLVEMFDPATRIAKTNFTLGWPANPRDAVTISRTFNDATTLIDISTSLPRSPDEPAYLRPAPPYVRSDVKLLAWCIQLVQPPPSDSSPQPSEQPVRRKSLGNKLRITCYWQHDVKVMWNFNSSSTVAQQLGSMVLGLYRTVQKRAFRVPTLTGYGNGVTIERMRFEIDREALTIDYAIHPEEDHDSHAVEAKTMKGMDELHAVREARRLTRALECSLLKPDGWDVQVTTKASRQDIAKLPWTATAVRTKPSSSSPPASPTGKTSDKVVLSFRHASLPDDQAILKVRVSIEYSSAQSGLRLNGLPQTIEDHEERDPSYFMSKQMLQDTVSTADLSFRTGQTSASSVHTTGSGVSGSSKTTETPGGLMRVASERTAAGEKGILSRVKRNYIYFSSLLQEPEQKWKRTTEGRGVEVTQLDSIDPTLVVYRAEATFVGVGLWDLFATIVSPGARTYWDKLHEDATLLEDVNELTELWQYKTRPAWPVVGRDSVVLRTVYKSPTAVHVFAFSADDLPYFSNIPPPQPNTIRTQVDLQGWSIEALSPTTTSITLLEQSDPKGWSNKASIPQQMINTLAGIGDFAIKCGGPPVATRLAGAKATQVRYDHDRGHYRLEYQGSASRRSTDASTTKPGETADGTSSTGSASQMPVIECELRCDIDNWAPSLDIVVDPPPQSITCLRRHRLSEGGGGLWLTITHDAVFSGDERILAIVRRGPGKEKGLVMVNGAKVNVDVEELPESEVKNLAKKKRVKPQRIPLDQPPVLGAIRRRKAEWDADSDHSLPDGTESTSGRKRRDSAQLNQGFSAPKFTSPLTKFFTMAVESATATTQQAVAAISPPPTAEGGSFPNSQPPMQSALEALAHLQKLYPQASSDDWALVSEKGFPAKRKLCPDVSPSILVHRGEKVIEGVAADELASALTQYGCRKQWDDRFDSAHVFETFGAGCHTAFVVTKGGFPFRDRGFYLASVVARMNGPPSASRRNSGTQDNRQSEERVTIFYVSASFNPESVASYSPNKYNSYNLPIGRVIMDGWALETLDPYGTENYAIPSTRCTRIVAVDYAGSIPAAVNSMINAALPRSIGLLETYMKTFNAPPIIRLPHQHLRVSSRQPDGDCWVISTRDGSRKLVSTTYQPDSRTYWTFVQATFPAAGPGEDVTPRQSRLGLATASSPKPTSTAESPRRKDSVSSDRPRPASRQDHSLSPREAMSRSPPRHSRMRTQSSAYTLKPSDLVPRVPTDLVLAELAVDAKLYPEGFAMRLRSDVRDNADELDLPSTPEDAFSLPEKVLPVACGVYTLPPSGLHSADTPPRRLVRLTLPTAQYAVSTLEDPLTGETRTAPPKPKWLLDLEEGKRAVLHVEIRPATASNPTGSISKRSGSKEPARVLVDDAPISILDEKESLKALGRDELLDDGTGKAAVLSRTSAAEESMPVELRTPLAVARGLMDPVALASVRRDGTESTPAASQDESESPKTESVNEVRAGASAVPHPADGGAVAGAAGGLLGFLNSYSTPLMRLSALTPRGGLARLPSLSGEAAETPGEGAEEAPPGALAVAGGSAPAGVRARAPTYTYPLSSVLAVALIAFLLGSLLRSLLSPAEFVYVVKDAGDVQVQDGQGWREIRRLFEVKYILGGWDFQVAVVRRH